MRCIHQYSKSKNVLSSRTKTELVWTGSPRCRGSEFHDIGHRRQRKTDVRMNSHGKTAQQAERRRFIFREFSRQITPYATV